MSVVARISCRLRKCPLDTRQCLKTCVSQTAVRTASKKTSDIDRRFKLPSGYKGSGPSIWVEYTQLGIDHKPLNLGLGFPEDPPPQHVVDALIEAASNKNLQQYTRGFGHPRFIQAHSKLFSKLLCRELNPQTELLATIGAYEALYCIIAGHVDVGDEVIIIEPFFDCYQPMVKAALGVPKFIALKPKCTEGNVLSSGDFVLDQAELEGLFNKKTKAIILNTPNNPLGKVYTLEELTAIACLCKKHNVLCICDEVYEWMIYEPNKHIRMATLPGMWERTITVGSGGKTLGATGWKVGWAYGPANLMFNLQMVHQNLVYTCCTPIQEAAAIVFETELCTLDTDESYLMNIPKKLTPKRDCIAQFLQETGFKPIIPEGGFFMAADWTPLTSKVDLKSEKDKYKDFRFTKWMTKKVGLQGIPISAFYSDEHKSLGEGYVRYCFSKRDETLQAAADILRKWKSGSKK